jgi:integrase
LFLFLKDIASRQLITLTPISRAKMDYYTAQMIEEKRHRDSDDIGNYMSENNFKILLKHLRRGQESSYHCSPDDISPYVQMCYFYGVRRSESMALTSENLKETHLLIERQAEKLKKHKDSYVTKVLKGRAKRKTPHWMIDVGDAYSILMLYKAKSSRVFHPDTFTEKFSKAITEINLEKKFEDNFGNRLIIGFTIHDLRRSFITNAFRRGINPIDIQLAVGHKDLRTTLAYQTDDRSLDDRTYKPKTTLKEVG